MELNWLTRLLRPLSIPTMMATVTVINYFDKKEEGAQAEKETEPDMLKAKYEKCLMDARAMVGNARWEVKCVDIATTEYKSTKEAVSAFANKLCDELYGDELAAVVMFCGYSGRKALYTSSPESKPMIMGSTTDFSMREAQCTNVIAKPGSVIPDAGTQATYLVHVDGNASSEQAVGNSKMYRVCDIK